MRKVFVLLAILFLSDQNWAIDLGSGSSSSIFAAIKKTAQEKTDAKATIYDWGGYTDEKGQRSVDFDGKGDAALFLSDGYLELDDPLFQVTHYAFWLCLFERDLKKLDLMSASSKYFDEIEHIAINEIDEIRKLPSNVSQEYLIEEFRKDVFGSQYSKVEEKFAKALNEALSRKYKKPPLKFTVGAFARGGGQVMATIKTLPKNARVSMITFFHFSLCAARNIDPWNTEACYGWRDVLTNKVSVCGDYKYIAKWQDGSISRGQFTIDFNM